MHSIEDRPEPYGKQGRARLASTAAVLLLLLCLVGTSQTAFALQGPESFGWGNGGWFSSLEIDKTNPNVLYAASDMGGVFRSDDAGDHWADLSAGFPGTPVWNLTLSPDGSALYAQTMLALLKSTDKGHSWTSLTVHHEDEISPAKPMVTRFHGAQISGVRRTRTVVIDPADQNVIYLAGERGKDNHDLISSLNYLYRTTDGGQTWEELSTISDATNSLVLDPSNRSILYAAGADGVRRSTDGGITWTAKNTGITNLEALDMRADHRSGALYLLTKSGFYKSTDRAETWLLYNGTGGGTLPAPNRNYGVFLIDETNSNHIILAFQGYIYETRDGASTWNRLFQNWSTDVIADPDYAYVWDCALFHCGGPTTDLIYNEASNLLYGAGDVGIAMLDLDVSPLQWTIKHRGLNVAGTNALAFLSNKEIYAGGADTVLMKTENAGQSWRQITGKDSWAFTPNFWVWSIGLKKTDPRKVYICNEMSARTSSAAAALFQSLNDGDSWEDITSRLPDAQGSTKCSQVLVDERNESIIYVLLNNRGLYRSADNAATFSRITDGIPSVDQMVFTSASFVIDPVSPNIFYLVPRNGARVFKSIDSGASWTQIYQYGDNAVGGITILQDAYHSIYLSMQHRLQRSRDQGATWQTVMNLDQMVPYVWSWHYYFSIPVFNPLNGKTYVQITPWTHDPQNLPPAGIYASADFGNTWERAYPLAHPGGNQIYLTSENDYLYVPATSGLWKYKLDVPSIPPTPTATPNPDDGQTFADVPPSHPYYAEIEWLYQNGYTAGCAVDPLRYCPDQTMNRAESAVFVERGIHTASYDPPVPATQIFADVALDSWAAKWVNGLWQDQYTAGCGTNPLIYCPWQGHTRAEGCVFYLRMLRGPNYEPPQPTQQTFVDVPLDVWYARWVQAAFDAALLKPCESSPDMRFCPDDPLSRGLAAYMMVRAKSATGRTYYVSPGGADSNPGTLEQPWKTIQKAANTIAGGDTVIVEPGQYTEDVSIATSGSTNAQIAYLGSKDTVLNGKFDISASYVQVNGFEIRQTDPGGDTKVSPVRVNGDYVWIINNTIRGGYGPGILSTAGSKSGVFRGNTISNVVEAGIFVEGNGHLVENNDISHIRDYLRTTSAYRTDADGIRFFGDQNIVRGNSIHDLWHSECLGSPHIDCFQTWRDATDITIDKNRCQLADTDGMNKLAMVSRTSGNVNNLTFTNNLFISYNSHDPWNPLNIGNEACSSDTPIENVTVVNNTFARPGGAGSMALLLRCVNHVTVQNNLFIDWGNSTYPYINPERDVSDLVTGKNAVYETDGTMPNGGLYPDDLWTTDPGIVSLHNLDFHLLDGSSLIDAGNPHPEIGNDYDGTTRPQGAGFDIGAFEYIAR